MYISQKYYAEYKKSDKKEAHHMTTYIYSSRMGKMQISE